MAKPIIYKKDTKYDVSYINDKGESKTIEYIPEEDLSIAKIITDIKSKNKDYLKLGSIKLSEAYDLLRKENNQMSVEDNNLNNSLQSESTTKTTKEFRIMDGDKVLKTFSADEENKGYEEMKAMGKALKDAGKEDNLVYKEFRVKNKLKEDDNISQLSESRPDKDAAKAKMFRDSRKKLNMPDESFTTKEQVLDYLNKCDDETDVMNVNEHISDMELRNYMLNLGFNFSKAKGKYPSNAPEEFKQYMIDGVSKYNKVTESISENKLDKNVKDAFIEEYPDDPFGQDIKYDITFKDVLDGLKKEDDIYDIIGVNDSFVREGIFNILANLMNVDYDYVYKLWLYGERKAEIKEESIFEELEPIKESNLNESFFNLYKAMDQEYGIRKLTPKQLIDSMNDLKEAHRLSDKDYNLMIEFANKYQELIDKCGYEPDVLHEDNEIEPEIEDDFEELEADDIEDSTDTITEDSEDLDDVKDNIEQAMDSIDNPTPKDQLGIESTDSSIDVLDADEKSAVDGYEAFLTQAKEILPEALYTVLEKEVNEIISDEEDHEDKLAVIKSAFHLDDISDNEVEEALTEEKTIATYKDNSSLVKTIQADNGRYFNYYYDNENDQEHWSSKAGPFETADEAAEMVKKHRPLVNRVTESADEEMTDKETTYKQLEDKASKEAHDYLNEQGIPLAEANIDDYDNIEIAVDEALADYQPNCIEEYIDKTGDNIDWDYSLSTINPEIIKITINR